MLSGKSVSLAFFIAAICALSGEAVAQSSLFPANLPYPNSSLVTYFSGTIKKIQVVPSVAPVGTPRWAIVKLDQTTWRSPAALYTQVNAGLDLSGENEGLMRISMGSVPYSTILTGGTWYVSAVAIVPIVITRPGVTRIVAGPARNLSTFDGFSPQIETTVTTLPKGTARSGFDVNGMWYDPATNGSGISIHHSRDNSDAILGTWFMFDGAGATRWYSLQGGSWTGNGDEWEGVLIESFANCRESPACPVKIESSLPTFLVRIKFQSSSQAVAEVFGLQGEVLFRSNLRRLEQ